jgi:hypothetical protein
MTKKKKVKATPRLQKERGVSIIRADGKVSVSDVNRILRRIREEREERNVCGRGKTG